MRFLTNSRLSLPVALVSLLALLSGCEEGSGLTNPRLQPEAPDFDRTIAEGTTPTGGSTVVDCDGTMVDATHNGTLTFVLREDGSGGLHFTAQIDESVTGLGVADQVAYSGSTTGKETYNVPAPTFELTMDVKGNLQSAATPTNFTLHELFHITMNANGAVTATVDNTSC